MNLLIRLYPRSWRSRYEAEFAELLEERRLGLPDILDIVRAAMDARLYPQVRLGDGRAASEPSVRVPRLGSLGAVLGGAMLAVMNLVPFTGFGALTAALPDWLQFLLPLFFLVAILGLHSLSRGRTGTLGRAGAGLILLGLVSMIAGMLSLAYSDALWALVFAGLLGTFFGFVLFGIAVMRAGLLGRWSFMPLVVGVLGLASAFNGEPAYSRTGYSAGMVLWLLFALAWVLLGYALWSSRKQPQITVGPGM